MVLRLISSSYLVGACTGRLGRLLPLEDVINVRSRTPDDIGGVGTATLQSLFT